MRKIGIFFGILAAGLLTIIVSMSFIIGINPVDFFKRIHEFKAANIIYIALIYLMTIFTVHYLLKKDGKSGLSGLGLKFSDFNLKRNISYFLAAFSIFLIYIATMVLTGTAYLKHASPELISLAVQGIFIGFLYALAEEIIFRGYIYQTLQDKYSPILSAVVVSAIFAGLHIFRPGNFTFKIVYFSGLFLIGIALIRCLTATGTLWTSIFVHQAWIFSMYIMSSLVDINMDIYNQAYFLWGLDRCPIAGAFCILFISIFAGLINFRPKLIKQKKLDICLDETE